MREIKKSGSFFNGQCRRDGACSVSTDFSHFLSLCFFLLLCLFPLCLIADADDFYAPRRLGVSLDTLQKGLEKVGGSITVAPRSGSTSGTLEARLPDNAGTVQVAGGKENLAVVVLWLPVDKEGKLVGVKAYAYLETVVANFVSETDQLVLWVNQVLKRAVAEPRSTPYLESQLADKYQFKAAYVSALSPPMMSLTVTATEE